MPVKSSPRPADVGPFGKLLYYPPRLFACRGCQVKLHAVARPPGQRNHLNDWVWIDEAGASHIDTTPEELRTDPLKWWRRTIERHGSMMSPMLSSPQALGRHTWSHMHLPGEPIPDAVVRPAIPLCCGVPMYAGVDAWWCRITRNRFGYVNAPRLAQGTPSVMPRFSASASEWWRWQ